MSNGSLTHEGTKSDKLYSQGRPMTNQTQPVDVAVNHLLNMVQNQLGNVLSLVETQAQLVSESLNYETDQYNELIDRIEKAESERDTLELKVIELTKENEAIELDHLDKLNKLRSEFNLLKARTADLPALREEVKRYREMNPDALKQRLAKSRATADERLNTINRLKKESSDYRKENIRLKKEVTQLSEAALEATHLCEEYKARLHFIDGDVEKPYVGKDGLELFIYRYGYPLAFKPLVKNLSVIRDLNFHIELRSNWAVCCVVSVSDWLIPLIPTVHEFEGRIPTELYTDLQEIYTNAAEVSHQHLIARVEHFKEVTLESVYDGAITERELKLLNDANYFSVYSVMHPTDEQLAKSVKGISEASASKIRAAIDEKLVQPWERENWTKEQVNEVRRK